MSQGNEDKRIILVTEINPVDYYNFNYVQEAMEIMLKLKNVRKVSNTSFTYVLNPADKYANMFVIEDGFIVPKMKNGLDLDIERRYTPFMILQKFKFKDKFDAALSHVQYTLMNNSSDYIRVGYKYFKIIKKVDRHEVVRTELKLWDKQTLIDDHGKDIFDKIEKYDDFTIVPDNKSHTQIIGNNYNLYSEFSHKPCNPEDYSGIEDWPWTHQLMKHIFGEQYELGIKYMKILYEHPKQILPILVLASEERETGKSTFIDYVCILFGGNAVVVNPQDIANSFNGTYADKNIIAIEESRFEGTQTLEKLKALATQKKLTVNSKFVQQYSIPFYGKLIITSNDESKFSRVDNEEIRYWVRQVPTLKGKANHSILEDLTEEIPYFLHYLESLPSVDRSKSRMVFTADELNTKALQTVKKESRPALHKDLEILLDNFCMQNTKVPEIKFIATQVKEKWFSNNHRIEINYINRICKESLKLPRAKMGRFIPFEENINITQNRVPGQPFIYKNKYYDDTNRPEEEGNTDY